MYEALSVSIAPTEPLNDVTSDVADTGLADARLSAPHQAAIRIPTSPLQTAKTQNQTPPHQQPPPPPPPTKESSSDPLSLVQLRRLLTDFPKLDTVSYAFTYEDTAPFEEELNEWFSYNEAEYSRLLRAKQKFEDRWKKFGKKPWLESNTSEHQRFIEREVAGLRVSDLRRRCKSLQTILHIALGVWDVTAHLGLLQESTISKTKASPKHLKHIRRGVDLLAKAKGIPVIFDVLQDSLRRLMDDKFCESNFSESDLQFLLDELDSVTTIFYLIILVIHAKDTGFEVARDNFAQIAPTVLNYFLKITASLRFDELSYLPQSKVIVLLWKTILICFGGISEADSLKKNVSGDEEIRDRENIITASPLDYHIFRQEIMSKYPAYTPPQPLIPIEQDNFTILPPLSNRSRRGNGSNDLRNPALNVNCSGASILHQSVHIATPAPSPPPSPPVGGKAGKKQNYQTNQNFPFMYPPLDNTSCSAGGKGLAGLQEKLVGRKWEGSDIPKSILEAGSLFSQRMRMSRAMRQLWDEREKYIKFERGWDTDDDIEELDLNPILANEMPRSEFKRSESRCNHDLNDEVHCKFEQKLDLIESFYKDSLPYLQSLVIVLLRVILANVTAQITLQGGQYQAISTRLKEANIRANGFQDQSKTQEPTSISSSTPDPSEDLVEDLEASRSREITTKAVTGIILLLLKWFKVSHILKFEYLTQLLLDTNYFPLVLKYLVHQDIERVINIRIDNDEMSFFAFCNTNSIKRVTKEEIHASDARDDSEDDAAPLPIKRKRKFMAYFKRLENLLAHSPEDEHISKYQNTDKTEVSLSTSSQPELITEFSWRVLFTLINLIRIMQKICKNKTHRNLLLVQYKSSAILKRLLRIPQSDLRVYILKVFKNQVPYCGRKWRQGNMRIITAIYLHCRPELRDDWLAGCDIVADVEEALPLEQALRALTHWHNVRHYPNQMGTNLKLVGNECDFFIRELEKMAINDEGVGEANADIETDWECASISGC